MSGNLCHEGGGVGRLMANAILNFHFDYPHTSLSHQVVGAQSAIMSLKFFIFEVVYTCCPNTHDI